MTLKDHILTALEASREIALSGQALAQRFGVSRNAVWKAINTLKEDGYEIESTPNRGYCLAPECDRFSEGSLRAALANQSLPIYIYDTVDSTNNQAKRLLANGTSEPFMVVAETQTKGRGRHGRTFYSPSGVGLYMTVAISPGQAVTDALGITAYAAVSVVQSIYAQTGLSARIKWVNDLYLNGQKICGILTEAVTDFESGTVESLLVGIGINLRKSIVPTELQGIIGALDVHTPIKNQLAAAITDRLLGYLPGDTTHLALYRAYSMTLNRAVQCTQGNESFIGTAVAINEDGALVVQNADGSLRTLRSGEARLLD